MNDSSAIILLRPHSTDLERRLPSWIKVCQYDESQTKKHTLHYNNAPHQTVEYRLRGICIIAC